MKIPKVIGTVRWIQYKKFVRGRGKGRQDYCSLLEMDCFYDMFGENIMEPRPDNNDPHYYANAIIEESRVGKGNLKKEMWKVTIYMTEEEYDTRPIESGDIIELYNVQTHKTDFKILVYDKEKLKQYPEKKTKIHYAEPWDCPVMNHGERCNTCNYRNQCNQKDKYIKAYFDLRTNDMKMSVRAGNWKMRFKNEDIYRMMCGNMKIPFDTFEELRSFQEGEWLITDKEAINITKAIEKYGEMLPVVFYSKKNAIRKAVAKVSLYFLKSQEKNVCRVEIKSERPLTGQRSEFEEETNCD